MPEGWVWWLLISVVVLALGVSLKCAELSFQLKMANQVISGLWKKIDILNNNNENDKSISNKQKLDDRIDNKVSNEPHEEILLYKILKTIAKYHSQEIPATPELISKEIDLDPEITLAYMWKYHNEQYITFKSRGEKPGIKTPFYLSPKALNEIEIIKAAS